MKPWWKWVISVFNLLAGALYNALNDRVYEQSFAEDAEQDHDHDEDQGDEAESFEVAVEYGGEPESEGHSGEEEDEEYEEEGDDDPGEVAGGFGHHAEALEAIDLHPCFDVFFDEGFVFGDEGPEVVRLAHAENFF